jgi:predicted transcriptional regulator
VVDNQGTLVGQISRHDVLRAIDSLTHQNHSH